MLLLMLALAGGLAFLVLALRAFSPQIYDAIILHMTSVWYMRAFDEIAATQRDSGGGGAPFRLLDVGIGTASALLANKGRIVSQNVHVTGVDYNAAYVAAARGNIAGAGMGARITVHCASIYEWASPHSEGDGGTLKFDAGYFSGSFSLMPDPLEALVVVAGHVKRGGHVYITQTFQRKGFPGLSLIKPLTKHVTTIDFGQLYYEAQLEEVLARAEKKGLKVLSNEVIPNSKDNMFQAARCIVFKVL